MPTKIRLIGLVVALSSLVSLGSGCICARAPYHGRIPSRNLARAREPVPEQPRTTTQALQPEYVVAR